jgi:1-acyl-sn-glycerol-3-phosphate acyltransferase
VITELAAVALRREGVPAGSLSDWLHEAAISRALDATVAWTFILAARLVTGASGRWIGCQPEDKVRIYFANHASHLDFILLWSALPPALRNRARPVAAREYWQRNGLRHYLSSRVFRSVYVERHACPCSNPIAPLLDTLDGGESLILFPEGTRGSSDDLRPFRSGIFHLAAARPNVELVPVWLDNPHRVMPKGSVVPVPLLCTATFGRPTRLVAGEDRTAFLARLHEELLGVRAL